MISLRTFCLGLVAATGLALVFVHQEILQVETSYGLRTLERTVRDLEVEEEQLALEVARLTRPEALAESARSLDLRLATAERVVMLPQIPRERPGGVARFSLAGVLRTFSFAPDVFAKPASPEKDRLHADT